MYHNIYLITATHDLYLVTKQQRNYTSSFITLTTWCSVNVLFLIHL